MASLFVHSFFDLLNNFLWHSRGPSIPSESPGQDISKLFGGLPSKLWPLPVMTPPPSYTTRRYSGSDPNSLFHKSVEGKVIHPPEESLGDFALNDKGGTLMVDFQASTDRFILVRPWG